MCLPPLPLASRDMIAQQQVFVVDDNVDTAGYKALPLLYLGVCEEGGVGSFEVVGPGHIFVHAASCFPVVKEHSNDLHDKKLHSGPTCCTCRCLLGSNTAV